MKTITVLYIHVKLLLCHEICVARREEASGITSEDLKGSRTPASSLSGRGGRMGRGGSGEVGGRIGFRGSGASTSSLFRGKSLSGSTMKPSLSGGRGMGMGGLSSHTSGERDHSSTPSPIDANTLIASCLKIQESATLWLAKVCSCYTRLSAPNKHNTRDDFSLFLEWLHKVVCLHHSFVNRILEKEVDKSAASYARDQCCLSSLLLSQIIDTIKTSARSQSHLSAGFNFLENVIHRSLRKMTPGNTTGVVDITDYSIVSKIFSLCSLVMFEKGTASTVILNDFEIPVITVSEKYSSLAPDNQPDNHLSEKNVDLFIGRSLPNRHISLSHFYTSSSSFCPILSPLTNYIPLLME